MLSHHSPWASVMGSRPGKRCWDQPKGQWKKYRWSTCGEVHSQNQSRIWLAASWCLDVKVFQLMFPALFLSSSPANPSPEKISFLLLCFPAVVSQKWWESHLSQSSSWGAEPCKQLYLGSTSWAGGWCILVTEPTYEDSGTSVFPVSAHHGLEYQIHSFKAV